MKARIKEIPTKSGFEPFILEIEVDKETDLFDLFHRLNISAENVMSTYTSPEDHRVPFPNNFESDTYQIWQLIDKKVKELRE